MQHHDFRKSPAWSFLQESSGRGQDQCKHLSTKQIVDSTGAVGVAWPAVEESPSPDLLYSGPL